MVLRCWSYQAPSLRGEHMFFHSKSGTFFSRADGLQTYFGFGGSSVEWARQSKQEERFAPQSAPPAVTCLY